MAPSALELKRIEKDVGEAGTRRRASLRRPLERTGTVGWFISEAPIVILMASFLLSSPHTSNRTGVAIRAAAGYEMTPRARVRGLLNRLPLVCELPLEGPGFDRLASVL